MVEAGATEDKARTFSTEESRESVKDLLEILEKVKKNKKKKPKLPIHRKPRWSFYYLLILIYLW